MAIETLMTLCRQAGIEPPSVPVRPRASAQPYDAGATGRRAIGWVGSRLGVNTLLWGNADQIRSRARDAIRNNPWAASAIDSFESNVIGTGIKPQSRHPDPQVRVKIEEAWLRWTDEADATGVTDYYGLQALVTREVFEAGEVLIRFRLRPNEGLSVPLQLQLIEAEQLPTFRNIVPSANSKNSVRSGIEFAPNGKRVAYHLYKEHPGETMFYPVDGLTFIRVPASEMAHVFKPVRAGQFRGQPMLTAVLALLYELDQYSDAELLRKKVAAMFAGFIIKPAAEGDVIPLDNSAQTQGPPQTSPDPGTANAKLEPGTLQELLPNEDVRFPTVPDSPDFERFINVQLHQFAAGCGLTYEQVTGDLRGVNYSSIRAGLLEFRRKVEQFQHNVIVFQACRPVFRRWLKEAVLCGALDLPGYFDDPRPYESVVWVTPGWPWVDPLKDVQASIQGIRAGLSTRSLEVSSRGYDSAAIDAEQASDGARADRLKLIYDSDPRHVLVGRETNPTTPAKPLESGTPEEEEAQEQLDR